MTDRERVRDIDMAEVVAAVERYEEVEAELRRRHDWLDRLCGALMAGRYGLGTAEGLTDRETVEVDDALEALETALYGVTERLADEAGLVLPPSPILTDSRAAAIRGLLVE